MYTNEYREIDNDFELKVYEILTDNLPSSISPLEKVTITNLIMAEHLKADAKMIATLSKRMFSRKENHNEEDT